MKDYISQTKADIGVLERQKKSLEEKEVRSYDDEYCLQKIGVKLTRLRSEIELLEKDFPEFFIDGK